MKTVEKHENIISLLGCCTKSGPAYAIVEYAKHGNLRNYLRSHRPKDYMLYSSDETCSSEDENGTMDRTNQNEDFKSILQLYSCVTKKSKLDTNSVSEVSCIQFPTNQLTSFVATSPSATSTMPSSSTQSSANALASPNLASINLTIDLVRFSSNIANGMKFLHSKKICHRDLAARNILVDEFKTAKIADFGFARDLNQSYYYRRKAEVSFFC